jgi:hypothetical protein
MTAMAVCIYCSQETGTEHVYHEQCKADYSRFHNPMAGAGAAQNASSSETPMGTIWLNILGVLSLLVGLWLLVVSPNIRSAGTDDYSTFRSEAPDVINLHKMYLGQTFTIVGAIFLAAAWRPHR